jgi:hypothetical protein
MREPSAAAVAEGSVCVTELAKAPDACVMVSGPQSALTGCAADSLQGGRR